MKKQYLSILLSLSLCFGALPAPVYAEDGTPAAYSSDEDVAAQAVDYSKVYTDSGVTTTGDGSEASPFKTFEEALNSVDEGGTIIIKGQGYLNDSANGGNGDHPLIISKELTIQGEADAENTTASFNIRAGGFVLGADVTIKNLELSFSGMVRPAIFVNGHTLTAETVSIDKSAGKGTAHIFAGGYSAASATAGSGAEIHLKNCSFGNIYAGGMGQAYDKNVSVTLDGSCSIDAIYGYGATDINTANEAYGSSGKLTVTLNNTPKGFKESNTTIDGTGAKSTAVSVNSTTYGKKLSLKKITDFSTQSNITIDSLDTSAGSMNIALNNNAKLNLLNSTGKSFGNLTGAGTLQIGKSESLAFLSVEGSHILETLTSDGIQGTAEFGRTYITQNGGNGTFTLANGCQGALMLFEKEGTEWKTSSNVTIPDKVSKFSFTKTEETMSGSDFREKGLIIPVSWTHQMLDSKAASLSHIPLSYAVSYNNGTPVTADSVLGIDSGMYEASLTINGTKIDFTAADKDIYGGADDPENVDRIELHGYSALSAGVYEITVNAPANSGPISATFTLTITDGTNPPAETKTLEKIEVTTPPTKTAYTAGEKFDKTGMVVTATYSNRDTAPVTSYTFSPDDALQVSDTSITISYTEGDVTKTTAQTITVTDATAPTPTEKKDITTDMFTVTDPKLTYNGTEQNTALIGAVAVKDEYKNKLGTVTVTAKHASGSYGTDCIVGGTYKLTVSCTGSDTYNATTTDLEVGTIQIAPASVNDIAVAFAETTYTGQELSLASYHNFTFKGKKLDLSDGSVSATVNKTAKDAGTYTVTISGNELAQCFTGTRTETWTIAPKEISVNTVVAMQKVFDGTTVGEISRATFNGASDLQAYDNVNGSGDYKSTVRYGDSNVGSDKPFDYTITLMNQNYTFKNGMTTSGSSTGAVIVQADPITPADINVTRKAGDTSPQTVKIAGLPTNMGTISADPYDNSGTKASMDGNGIVTITAVAGSAGNTVTIPITIKSTNYQDSTVNIKVTLTDKDVPTITAKDFTKVYDGHNVTADNIEKEAKFGNETINGSWSLVNSAQLMNVTDSGVKTLKFIPADQTTYAEAEVQINVTITPKKLDGAPSYTKITTSGKTLADAALQANDDWKQAMGQIKWADDYGAEIAKPENVNVEQGKAYNWIFVPASSNYAELSGKITLWEKPASSKPSGSSSSGGSSSSSGSSSAVKVPASSDHSTVNISASVSKGTASVSLSQNQIKQVISDGKTNVSIDVSGLKNVESAKLPANIISAANDAQDISLTVELPAGSVTLDENALGYIADDKDVTISLEKISTSSLSATQKAAIGEQAEVALVVDVNILVGSAKQSNFGSGKLTISVPYTPKADEDPANLTIWFILDDGTIENKGGSYDEKQKCFIFETEHLSKYILVNLKETKAEAPRQEIETYTPANFLDVSENAYYVDAVAWATANGITGGIKANYFGPDQACTRAQVVTFLWRAAGKPAAASDVHFSDVNPNAYYSEAIRWAAETGIISGYSNGLFGTDDPITREQMVAILYRYAQSIGMDTTQGGMAVREFLDYADISGYAVRAMQWAVNTDVLKGAGGYIMPDATCTRAQIVSFLYRIHQGK